MYKNIADFDYYIEGLWVFAHMELFFRIVLGLKMRKVKLLSTSFENIFSLYSRVFIKYIYIYNIYFKILDKLFGFIEGIRGFLRWIVFFV